jgi:membrane-bound lytic murein transglycosylase D
VSRPVVALLLPGLLFAACSRTPGPALPVPSFTPEPELADFGPAEAEADAAAAADPGPDLGSAALGFRLDPELFDLPIALNERVLFWVDFFAVRQRDWFATYLRRMGRYEEHILARLEARGLPQDLIYLALIESGFAPRAYSKAHAVGIWQFIPATGRRFGLQQTPYLDERRDPIRSTEAALSYLHELHVRFGSWYLAAAAYNCGENRVERLLQQHAGGARGDDDLFWTISDALPQETRNYVPKLLAAAIVAKYRAHYGFAVAPDAPERYESVWIPDATDLAVIAELAGVAEADLRTLNPQFLQDMTPPRSRVQVRLPAGTATDFAVRYAVLPTDRRVRFLQHTVARGETLSGIARQYGTTVAALQEANAISNPSALRAGATLIVHRPRTGATSSAVRAVASRESEPAAPGQTDDRTPIRPAPAAASPPAGPAAGAPAAAAMHRVAAGETLWSIARLHGVSVDDLRRWNALPDDRITPGRALIVGADRILVHEIQPGDTLWGIARRHGVTPRQLMDWNALGEDALLRPGGKLQIRIDAGR